MHILHITDLHLERPTGINEKLREGFYIDYINQLFNLIEAKIGIKLDYIVCTGDIINRGNIANFDHADKIFNYIKERSKVQKENTLITIGNHDLIVNSDTEGDRSRFEKFVVDNSEIPSMNFPTFSIKRDDKQKICFCLFDSIYNEKGEINAKSSDKTIYPSQLSHSTIDFIVNEIGASVPSDYLLMICCHFPMMVSAQGEMYTEQSGWVEKHLWKSGKTIAKRLIERRANSKTFFLFGDGHLPDFWAISNDIQFFMTGMFGGDFINITYTNAAGEKEAYNKTNQARLFSFNEYNSIEKITTFNYDPEGLVRDPQSGKWEMVDISKPRITKNDFFVPKHLKQAQTAFATSETIPSNQTIEPKQALSNPIELIAPHIQSELIREITTRHLYKIARTTSSNNESSLGWLPINQLFVKNELLSRCIDRATDWLIERISPKSSYDDFLIIGIGFWGSILGSQISIRLGLRNFCISSNLSGNKNNNYESLNHLCNYLNQKSLIKKIIVITDVISTGNSIVKVKKTIEEKCGGAKEYWAAISIVADKNQRRTATINEYNLLGSFCVDLPIPVINNELLPNEDIFPIEFDYR